MRADPGLLRALAAIESEPFSGECFRVTPVSTHPLAPSVSGGRWAPPALPGCEVPILYTSLAKDGALAEVASYLALLTPVPGPRDLKVARIRVSAAKALRLSLSNLGALGVDPALYGRRDYARTQEIGVAVAEFGCDALIAPSARWPCDNLMIFPANGADAEILAAEEVEWCAWAVAHGLLPT